MLLGDLQRLRNYTTVVLLISSLDAVRPWNNTWVTARKLIFTSVTFLSKLSIKCEYRLKIFLDKS